MSSSAGRRSAAYVAARRTFQTGNYPCTINYPGCTGIGTTVDHHPALALYANEQAWRAAGGIYRPACQPCQSRQGTIVRMSRRTRSRTW